MNTKNVTLSNLKATTERYGFFHAVLGWKKESKNLEESAGSGSSGAGRPMVKEEKLCCMTRHTNR